MTKKERFQLRNGFDYEELKKEIKFINSKNCIQKSGQYFKVFPADKITISNVKSYLGKDTLIHLKIKGASIGNIFPDELDNRSYVEYIELSFK